MTRSADALEWSRNVRTPHMPLTLGRLARRLARAARIESLIAVGIAVACGALLAQKRDAALNPIFLAIAGLAQLVTLALAVTLVRERSLGSGWLGIRLARVPRAIAGAVAVTWHLLAPLSAFWLAEALIWGAPDPAHPVSAARESARLAISNVSRYVSGYALPLALYWMAPLGAMAACAAFEGTPARWRDTWSFVAVLVRGNRLRLTGLIFVALVVLSVALFVSLMTALATLLLIEFVTASAYAELSDALPEELRLHPANSASSRIS